MARRRRSYGLPDSITTRLERGESLSIYGWAFAGAVYRVSAWLKQTFMPMYAHLNLDRYQDGVAIQIWNKFILGPSICRRVRKSSLECKTGYNTSFNLQNRVKEIPRQHCARFWMTWRLRGSFD